MGLMALFRREPAPGETPKAKRGGRAGKSTDHEATVQRLRQQARRRLLGAAVLVGVGIIAFPIVFETQPRPVPMDLPIVIPAKDRSEAPRNLVAAAELPASLPEAAELQTNREAAAASEPLPPVQEPVPEPVLAKPQPKPSVAEAAPAAAGSARFVVQVGAFADKAAAQTARKKLEAKGLKTYAQVAKTKDGDRIRVRLGPFADRAEAEKAAAKAKAAGLAGAVLTL
jgi:DedD protein